MRKKEEKLSKEIKPKLFTKGMNKAGIIHYINEVTGVLRSSKKTRFQ